jgi:hypothetical protein
MTVMKVGVGNVRSASGVTEDARVRRYSWQFYEGRVSCVAFSKQQVEADLVCRRVVKCFRPFSANCSDSSSTLIELGRHSRTINQLLKFFQNKRCEGPYIP